MRVYLVGHYRKLRVLRLLILLALVIISSSFAGAFVADAPHLLNETVKTGVHGSFDVSTASTYANNSVVNSNFPPRGVKDHLVPDTQINFQYATDAPKGYTNVTININGDQQLESSNFVVSGNGTSSNPFVISGLKIYDYGTTAISVVSTNLYLMIENVSIAMADLPVNSSATEVGIYLQNDSNLALENIVAFSPYPQPIRVSPSNGEAVGVSTFLSIFGSENISVVGIKVYNTSSGINADNSDNLTVENIDMKDISGDRPFFTYEVNDSYFISNLLNATDTNYMFQDWKGHNDVFSNNVGNFASGDSIWIYKMNNTSVINNTFSNCPLQSILESFGQNDTIVGNRVYNTNQAIILEGGNNITVAQNTLFNDSSGIGLDGYTRQITDSTIENNNIFGMNSSGISSGFGNSRNVVIGNTIADSEVGISFSNSPNNIIDSNVVYDDQNGIQLHSSSSNLIYNNYFSNENNAYSDSKDSWNITNSSGINIMGYEGISGNFWSNWIGSSPYDNNGTIIGYDYGPLHSSVSGAMFSLEGADVGNSNYFSIPIYASNVTSFTNITQLFSFNQKFFEFSGIAKSQTSQNVRFLVNILNDSIIKINGQGFFQMTGRESVLYFLMFKSISTGYTSTQILLDETDIDGIFENTQATASVSMGPSWVNLGPENISRSKTSPFIYGTGATSQFNYSVNYPNVMYVGSSGSPSDTALAFGGLFVSGDFGKTWRSANGNLPSSDILAVVENPNNPNEVVVSLGQNITGTEGAGTYKSVDGGVSWVETFPSSGNVFYYHGLNLYEATSNSLIESHNFGSTWSIIYDFTPIIRGYGLQVTAASFLDGGRTVYVGLSGYEYFELYESTDGGISFTRFWTTSEFGWLSDIVVDPANSNIMWLVFFNYQKDTLFLSNDSGESFAQVNLSAIGLGNFFTPGVGYCPQVLAYDQFNSSIVFIGGDNYFFRSTDGGRHFFQLFDPGDDRGIYSVKIYNRTATLVGCDQGLYLSYDLGDTWISLDNRSSSLFSDIAVDGNNIITDVQDYAPIASHDGGKTWDGYEFYGKVGEGGFTSVDPYNSSIVVMENGAILLSTDGGLSFNVSYSNMTAANDFTDLGTINRIGFSPNGSIFVTGKDGVLYLSNLRGKWTFLNKSPMESYVIAVSPSYPYNAYVSNDSGLFVSNGNLSEWSKISNIIFISLAIDPGNSSIIAGVPYSRSQLQNVNISEDGGYDWKETYKNPRFLPQNIQQMGAVYFDSFKGTSYLFYVGLGKILESNSLGSNWTNISFNLTRFGAVTGVSFNSSSVYISTYGSGVWENQYIFDTTHLNSSPLLTGFVPSNMKIELNGASENLSGYFSIYLRDGNNTIDWEGEKLSLNATNDMLYFYNFSNMQNILKVSEKNLPAGTEWYISANGNTYSIRGTAIITLPPLTNGIYVSPVATEYSIYYPSKTFYPINSSSLSSSIYVNFTQKEETSNSDITSKVSGIMWEAGSVYNDGYILYYGQGLGLYDVKDGSFVSVNSQIPGYFRSATPFGSGFVLGGSNYGNGGILGFYNLTDMSLENLTGLMPQTWHHMASGVITSVTASNGYIYFSLVASGHNYLGGISGTKFTNLTSYIYSYQYNGGEQELAIDYIGSINAIVFSTYWNQGFLGLLYLSNLTAENLTAMIPHGIGYGNIMSTSSAVVSSAPSSFDLVASGQNGTGYIGIFEYSGNSFLHTSLWLPYFSPSSTEWDGHDYIISGQWSNGDSYIVAVSLNGAVSYIFSDITGSGTLINSVTSVDYSRLAIVYYYNGSYSNDHYSLLSADPISTVKGVLTPNNGSLYINGIQAVVVNSEYSFPIFSGNATISYSAPGYATESRQIYVPQFSTSWENFSLNSVATNAYQIVFIENGLPSGTLWSVNLNGTMESSSSNSITFSEPNGTYPYSLTIPQGYTVSNSSGTIMLSGKNVTQTVTFISNNSAEYTIIFTESGLPSGISWSVTINGNIKSSTTNTITFTEPYGTYTYSITLPSGYKTTSQTGTITTAQSNTNVPVSITSVSKTTTPLTTNSYLLIGVIVVVIVIIALVGAVIVTKRSKNRGGKPNKLQEHPNQPKE